MSDISPYFSSSPMPVPDSLIACPSQGQEVKLYESLLAEAYNRYGVQMTYYIVSYDTKYDPIFGESCNETAIRGFQIMTYFELPNEAEMFSKFGIDSLENFHIYVSKAHFAAASTYDNGGFTSGTSGCYNEYIPQVGDVLRSNYNGIFYECTKVKAQEEQFLAVSHSWDILVKRFGDEHYNVSQALSGDDISKILDVNPDIFNISGAIDTEKPKYLYDASGESTPPRDPFAL